VSLFSKIRKNIRAKKASNTSLALALAASLLTAPVYANPYGANVVHGGATVSGENTASVIVTIPNSNAIINWSGFSINSNESTQFLFNVPGGAVLNRVTGADVSNIFGSLSANNQGSVFLINPNGIVFGPNAHVNVPYLVASTLNISDDNFKNFTQTGVLTLSNGIGDGNVATGKIVKSELKQKILI